MKITYVYADTKEEWNCSEWRCAVPARAIQRTGRHTAFLLDLDSFAKNTPEAQSMCGSSDVIVVQRNLFGPVLNAIMRWKARDKVVIADFDDAYNLMTPAIRNYNFWIQGQMSCLGTDPKPNPARIEPPPLEQFKWGLRLVNAATVPSNQLADDWRGYADVYYLPNFIELERYLNSVQPQHEGTIIGWGGSVSHLQSFTESGVVSALKKVCLARPRVKVMICGDDRVYDLLPIPEDQKIFKSWVHVNEWPQQLALFDIGIAPLSGSYDQRRSWIKVLEYMVMKIPWVASDGPAYRPLRDYGWLVQNTSNAWERVLLDMVDHLEDHRIEAANEPYLFGISQNIDENIEQVISIYSTLISKTLTNFSGLPDKRCTAGAPDKYE